MNWATKFCLLHHIHLTSHQTTTTSSSISRTFCRKNTSTTSRKQKMPSKSSVNPEAWIFTLQECVCVQSLGCVLTLSDPMDCSPPDFSVHGIFQARILEWVAIFFSREKTQALNPCLLHCMWILSHCTTWETQTTGINKHFSLAKNVLIVMVSILINKGVFEPNYNDLKFTVQK